MGTGASRPRKEYALQKYVKAAKAYNDLHNTTQSGKSRKTPTWRQKLTKRAGNLFNRVTHWGQRRSNSAKLRSAKRKAAEKLNRAEHEAYIANQQNEASARAKINRTVRGMTQRQRYNAAVNSFRGKYNNNNLSFPHLPGEPALPKHEASFMNAYMTAYPHTKEVERVYADRKRYNGARRRGENTASWLLPTRRRTTGRGVSV
jgi:hypothetical protein